MRLGSGEWGVRILTSSYFNPTPHFPLLKEEIEWYSRKIQ